MQAVILVGGEGTRLRPLTYGTPKPMVPLFGMPFLEWTLSRLHLAGIDDAILAAGYLPRAITDHLGDGSRLGMKLTYVLEDEPLGTAGAIRNVAEHIRGPFFVLNGDVLTSLDLRAMLEAHRRSGALGSLHLIRVEDPSAFGCVVHDQAGRVLTFVEKPRAGTAPTDEINAGTYLLEAAVLDAIPSGRSVSIERETFPELLAAGAHLHAHVTADYWLDLGRPEHYLAAHRDVLDGRLVLWPPADGDALRGRTYAREATDAPQGVLLPGHVAEGASIASSASVGPYTVLGRDSRVGERAVVRGSILWDGVAIDPGAVVEDAILASNVHVGAGARIGAGSVIGHDVVVKPNAVVPQNARLSVRTADDDAGASTQAAGAHN